MDITSNQQRATAWFRQLRDDICSAFEHIENELQGTPHAALAAGRFERKRWNRDPENGVDAGGERLRGAQSEPQSGGGGEMSIMRGRVFEKVGVNISTVFGKFSPEFRANIPGAMENDGVFWASGISLVAHMRSPLVPAVHMNTRHIVTSKSWFGGGADLTPMVFDSPQSIADKADFHAALKTACDQHGADYYKKFSKGCDEYFYLKHRNEPRGVGGIFYDYHDTGIWEDDFAFTQDVGRAFLNVYPAIVRRHMEKPWTAAQREHQRMRRGRYVEFNLLYDRGTTFGLKTNGNTEAILMSLPPDVAWP